MAINQISKQDIMQLDPVRARAGQRWWQETEQRGRIGRQSVNAEEAAPKTWLLWKNAWQGEVEAVIECEIYIQPRASDPREMVGVLHGMCPKCGETFLVREDNKEMALDWVIYRESKGHLRASWAQFCRERGRSPRQEDKIAVVSSPERWQCDYCKSWCVRVTDSIAITDMTGATQLYVTGSLRKREDGTDELVVATKESEILL